MSSPLFDYVGARIGGGTWQAAPAPAITAAAYESKVAWGEHSAGKRSVLSRAREDEAVLQAGRLD